MATFNAQKISKLPGDSLFYAPKGNHFRNEIHSLMNFENDKDLVKIDLKSTKSVDSSFCREGFIYLLLDLSRLINSPQVLFTNVNDNVKENMDVSFSYHKRFALAMTKDNNPAIIGKCPEPFADTIWAMFKLKEAKARDVAKELNIEALNTVNNRLKTIYDMCIVSRKEVGQETGGKEFVYFLNR